jgi:hypothetical protein
MSLVLKDFITFKTSKDKAHHFSMDIEERL